MTSPGGADLGLVVALAPRDVPQLARLHLAGLPSPLGRRAGRHLLEMYYGCLAPENGGVGYIIKDGDCVFGFVAGVWNRRRVLWASLCHFPLRFSFWIAVEFFLSRPLAFFRPSRRGTSAPDGDSACAAQVGYELRPLVVAESARGRGIGAALCRRLLEDARDRGFRSVFLRVDRENAPAIRCYERLGFRSGGANGRFIVMSIDLPAAKESRS